MPDLQDVQSDFVGPKNEIVVDIPGVGVRSFPATLTKDQIQANIRVLQNQAQERASSTMNRDPRAAMLADAAKRGTDMAMNPELWGGLAGMMPGFGNVAAPAAGAIVSGLRDVVRGDTDPTLMAIRAAGHATANAIPGAVGGIIARKAMPAAAEVGMDVATHGPIRGMILSGLRAALGGGEKAAANIAAPVVDELGGMALADGTQVLSSEGLKKLVQKSVELENAGAPRAQLAALDDLISKVTKRLATQGTQPANVLGNAGLPVTTAAERAAATRAAAATAATQKGRTISSVLRGILGLGSEGYDATRQTP